MSPLNTGEVLTALGVTAFGLAYAWIGSTYEMGSLNQMGPGFVPVCVGLAVAGLGATALVENRLDSYRPDQTGLRAIVLMLLSIVAWALLVRRFGIVPATIVLVLVSSLADRNARPLGSVCVAIGLALVAWLLFVQGFGLSVPIIDW